MPTAQQRRKHQITYLAYQVSFDGRTGACAGFTSHLSDYVSQTNGNHFISISRRVSLAHQLLWVFKYTCNCLLKWIKYRMLMLKISIEFKDTVHQVSADVSTIGGFHCLM